MNFETILGSVDFLEYLRGKKATFLLSASVTKTCEIPNILQTEIPEKPSLKPTLDAEFLCLKEARSSENIAKNSALITRAVHELKPFSNIEILNLGLEVKPKLNYFKTHNFDLEPSSRIDDGANINAMAVFQAGVQFASSYETNNDYIILAQSVSSGEVTAMATAKALGYTCESYAFDDIKNNTIEAALKRVESQNDVFTKLSTISDNMLIFNAGFILGSTSKDLKVILAGGMQMATVLLIVNSILKSMQGEINSSNLALCTTRKSNVKKLLEQIDFKIDTYCADSELEDEVGCGAALCYASINGINKTELTNKIESLLV